MTEKGGATSAHPPSITKGAAGRTGGRDSGTGKVPACGVHGSYHERLTIRIAVGSKLGCLVGQTRRKGEQHPSSRVHGGNHQPLHDGAKRVHPEEKSVRRIRYPVLCMRTNQPNQRPPNHNHHATQLDRSVALPLAFAWWERHFAYSQGPRVRAITAVAFRHQSLGDADTARQSHRSARTKRELKGLAVLLIRARS